MRNRRHFLKLQIFAFLSPIFSRISHGSDSALVPLPDSNFHTYKVTIQYKFDSSIPPANLMSGENTARVDQVNSGYFASGRLLEIKDLPSGLSDISKEFVFSSEASYLDWERDMVLARVIDRNQCYRISTEELRGSKKIVMHFHV